MEIRAKQVTDEAGRRVRRAALAADTALVLATPFDTGRASNNWIVSIGAPRIEVLDVTGPAGSISLPQGKAVIDGWQVGMKPIFIANSLPYIEALERGHSRQRPEGMTVHGIEAARQQLQGQLLPT